MIVVCDYQKIDKELAPCKQNHSALNAKKVIDATVYEENGQMRLKKTCPEHGTFKDVYWSDAALYERFAEFRHDGTGVDNPMTGREKGCPYDCGLCPEHKTTTVLSLIDVTNRCNQRCPVCFANAAAAGYVYEPGVDEIREMMQLLTRETPVRNWAIQFSGGEPTVRDDLPAIIRMVRDLGLYRFRSQQTAFVSQRASNTAGNSWRRVYTLCISSSMA